MSELTEFLLARITEDESAARAADDPYFEYDLDGKGADQFAHIVRWPPARVLARCAADRRIVERAGPFFETAELIEASGDPWEHITDDRAGLTREVFLERRHTLRVLASAYTDHPDYRQEWKP